MIKFKFYFKGSLFGLDQLTQQNIQNSRGKEEVSIDVEDLLLLLLI